MTINQQASAVLNNVVTGLRGLSSNLNLSIEQIEDQVLLERAKVILEYIKNGTLSYEQMALTIPCIPLSCGSTELCCSGSTEINSMVAEIPHILPDSIIYIGSNDRMNKFTVYTTPSFTTNKYRRYHNHCPYVYLDNSSTGSGTARLHVFNAPMMNSITITAVFRDPRVAMYMTNCEGSQECIGDEYMDLSVIANDTIHRLTEKLMRYYRTIAPTPTINDQTPKP